MPFPSAVDGLGVDTLGEGINAGVLTGRKLKWFGQTAGVAAGNVANQGIGTVALPALAAGAVGTVVVGDTLVTTNSLILLTSKIGPLGDATTSRGVIVWVESVNNGVGFTLGYLSPSAAMANPWACHYLVVN